jgi:hypothetical protein
LFFKVLYLLKIFKNVPPNSISGQLIINYVQQVQKIEQKSKN